MRKNPFNISKAKFHSKYLGMLLVNPRNISIDILDDSRCPDLATTQRATTLPWSESREGHSPMRSNLKAILHIGCKLQRGGSLSNRYTKMQGFPQGKILANYNCQST